MIAHCEAYALMHPANFRFKPCSGDLDKIDTGVPRLGVVTFHKLGVEVEELLGYLKHLREISVSEKELSKARETINLLAGAGWRR